MGVTILIKSPRSFVIFVKVDNKLPYVFVPIILLQHVYCTFVNILLGPFTRLFINLTMCIRALFTKFATTLCLVEQAFRRVPSFTEWVIASSFKVILARPSRRSTTRTLTFGTSGPRWFSFILLHERIRRRIWWCNFYHAYWYRGGNCSCLLSHIARWLPIANNLREFFVHAVLPPDSWLRRFSHNFHSRRQNSYFVFLARHFFSPSFSICDNQVLFLMNLQVIQFKYGLEFLTLSYS